MKDVLINIIAIVACILGIATTSSDFMTVVFVILIVAPLWNFMSELFRWEEFE